MRYGFGLVAVVCVLWAAPVAAQTHPCDVAVPVNPNLTSPVKTGFCHSGKDTDGNSTIITAFEVSIDGFVVFTGMLAPVGVPTADGRTYYESAPLVVSKGSHTVRVSAISAEGEGAQSVAYSFVVVGALPAPPTVPRVKK